jgi:penicillin-binding protein 1C
MVTDLEWSLQQRLERIAATHGGVGDGVAIVVLDRSSAAIRAMVGAASYGTSQLNAATSRRCLGSTLKPFLYAQAIQLGVIGPRSLVDDSPLQLGDFRPANFERGFAGSMDAAEALATSRNLPAIRLLQAVGCERFAELLWRLGLPVDHRALQLDAALGTAVASPLELAQAYQRFVTADVGLSSHAVEAVVAALSTRPLGTGAAAGAVAWKTGTSSGRRDAWSVGITGACVAVVWVGNLSGRGDPTLTGNAAASGLLARVVAAL